MKWVFVGCGGTFWAGMNLLASMVKKWNPEECFFVDPDVIKEENLQRQWVNAKVHQTKAMEACRGVLGPAYRSERTGHVFHGTFTEFVEKHGSKLDGQVLFIVNVDNDEARLDIREYCERHPRQAFMVMSGCDVEYGQVYTGWWDQGRAHHDWLESHPDISRRTPKKVMDACGQTFVSNMLTAGLLGPAIDEVCGAARKAESPAIMREWYWRTTNGKLRMWVDECKATGALVPV